MTERLEGTSSRKMEIQKVEYISYGKLSETKEKRRTSEK